MENRKEWCEKYYNKLFGPYFDKNTLYDLRLLMKKQGLSRIFKYRTGSDQDLINLENDVLASVRYYMFNDPFEFQFSLNVEDALKTCSLLHGEQVDANSQKFLEFCDKSIDIASKNSKKFNICCLSEENNSLLMWSHYANDHKGFCIEYDIFEVEKMNTIFSPVIYSDNMPNMFGDDITSEYNKMIFTKSPEWLYEKEWRIINYGDQEVHMLKMPKPIGIYLGCRASNTLKEKLIKYCKVNKINMFECEKNRFKYTIDTKKIDTD